MITNLKDLSSLGYKNREKEREDRLNDERDYEITFFVTNECNFRCTYCYEHKNKAVLNIENGKKRLDKLFNIEDNLIWWNGFIPNDIDSVHFDFFGGECLLEVEMMDALCSYFIEKCEENPEKYHRWKDKFYMRVATNGSLLRTKKVIAFLDKWHDRIRLECTIDGVKEFHDACRVFKDTNAPTFDIVYNNIKWVQENYKDIKISTKGTVTPESVKYLFDSYIFLSELFGYDKAYTTSAAIGVNWDSESLLEYKAQLNKIADYMLEHGYTNYEKVISTMVSRNDEGDNGNFKRCRLTTQPTCYLIPTAITLATDGKLYHCMQFADLNNDIRDGDYRPMNIGTIDEGITDEGLEFIEHIKHNTYPDMFKPHCAGCASVVECINCNQCYAFAEKYRRQGNFEENFDMTCKVSKIETAAQFRYMYLKEKKQWNHD
jgi:sulfatase maturation enzyme AslB (radical SAM superfamily)